MSRGSSTSGGTARLLYPKGEEDYLCDFNYAVKSFQELSQGGLGGGLDLWIILKGKEMTCFSEHTLSHGH